MTTGRRPVQRSADADEVGGRVKAWPHLGSKWPLAPGGLDVNPSWFSRAPDMGEDLRVECRLDGYVRGYLDTPSWNERTTWGNRQVPADAFMRHQVINRGRDMHLGFIYAGTPCGQLPPDMPIDEKQDHADARHAHSAIVAVVAAGWDYGGLWISGAASEHFALEWGGGDCIPLEARAVSDPAAADPYEEVLLEVTFSQWNRDLYRDLPPRNPWW